MATVQYGGAIGLTTDFQHVTSGFVNTPQPFIGIGLGSNSLDLAVYSASVNTVSSGTTPVPFYAKYNLNGTVVTTGHFGTYQTGGIDSVISPPQHYYPTGQQVLEVVFTFGTYDTVAHTVASDGSFFVYYNNSLIFSLTGINLGRGAQWDFIEFSPAGWATSYYVKQTPVRVTGYGAATYASPATMTYTLGSNVMNPPFTYPIPANFSFPVDPDILEANNFSTLNPSTYFYPTGRWSTIQGTGGTAGYPILDNNGINVLNASQTWSISNLMLEGLQAEGIVNNTSGSNAFRPAPLGGGSGGGTGTIIVQKVTTPTDGTLFGFTTSGLIPPTFNLASGQNIAYTSLATTTSYSVTETSDPRYATTYVSSNGSLHTALTVGTNSTTTLTVYNTFLGPFSGIYYIHPLKTNDTIFATIMSNGTTSPPSFTTTVVAIPNPFILI